MKKTMLALAFFASLSAFADGGIRPNNCLDGSLYRAMTGPGVETDAAGTKTIRADGRVLVECRVGNTDSCKGTTYNDYTCELNFAEVTSEDADAIVAGLNLGDGSSIAITHDYVGDRVDGCAFMHCTVEQTLKCGSESDFTKCSIAPVLSGWDE